MRVLGPVIDQEQYLNVRDRVGEHVKEALSLLVDQVQILEDDHHRLVERSRSKIRLSACSMRCLRICASIPANGSLSSTSPRSPYRYGSASSNARSKIAILPAT